jgi:hypothetical protein
MSDTEITLRHLDQKLSEINVQQAELRDQVVQLKIEMSSGKAAVRTVFWIGSVVAIVVGFMRIFDGG